MQWYHHYSFYYLLLIFIFFLTYVLTIISGFFVFLSFFPSFFFAILKAYLLSIISFDLLNNLVRLLGGKCPYFTLEKLGLQGIRTW